MDRQMDTWTDRQGWTDEPTDRPVERHMYGCIDGQTGRQTDMWTDERVGGRKQTDKQMNRWTDEQVDRLTGGQINRWTNEQVDR